MLHDRYPTEYTHVELPFIEQLKVMGWSHLQGDTDVPGLTERETFREVLLLDRVRDALRRINLRDDGREWLDEQRVEQALHALRNLGPGALIEANQAATMLLLKGTTVDGDPVLDDGKDATVQFVDFEHTERNDLLVVNQFRVDPAGGHGSIIPDLVLFVNGIPLVVVECKSPWATNPMEEGITQLLRYSNQRHWIDQDEGVERLFHYNQLLVSTYWSQARAGTVGAQRARARILVFSSALMTRSAGASGRPAHQPAYRSSTRPDLAAKSGPRAVIQARCRQGLSASRSRMPQIVLMLMGGQSGWSQTSRARSVVL